MTSFSYSVRTDEFDRSAFPVGAEESAAGGVGRGRTAELCRHILHLYCRGDTGRSGFELPLLYDAVPVNARSLKNFGSGIFCRTGGKAGLYFPDGALFYRHCL